MSEPNQLDLVDNPEPILDQSVLKVLSESVGEEVMADLVAASLADMRDFVRTLLGVEDAGAADEMRAVAHDLKSTAGSFGAMRLHVCARAIETACREGRVGDALASVAPIGPAAEEAFAALEVRFGLAPIHAG